MAPTSEITLSYLLEPSDLEGALRNPAALRIQYLLVFGLSLFSFILAKSVYRYSLVASLAEALFFFVLLLWIMRWSTRRSAQRQIEKLGEAKRRITFHFGEHALSIEASSSNSTIAYGDLHAYSWTEDTLLVYVSPQVIQFVPRRILGDVTPEALTSLLERKRVPRANLGRWFVLRPIALWVLTLVSLVAIWLLLGK